MIITIDSNIINSRQNDEVMNQIEEFAEGNKLKIVGSQRLLEEMDSHTDAASEKAESLENIDEPFTIGYSKIGNGYISAENNYPSFNQVASILFPNLVTEQLSENQSNDAMHLIAHIHSDSDYFVTRNIKDFIDARKTNSNRNKNLNDLKREKLEELGIYVKTPEEILQKIKAINK